MDVADGFGRVAERLPIDGDLHLLAREVADTGVVQILQIITSQSAIGADGGGTEDGALGIDILLHGSTKGEALFAASLGGPIRFTISFIAILPQKSLTGRL